MHKALELDLPSGTPRLLGVASPGLSPEVGNFLLSFPAMILEMGSPFHQFLHLFYHPSHPTLQLVILTVQLIYPLKGLFQVDLGGLVILLKGLKLLP